MIIMVMTMSLTFIHPIALDGLAVLLVAPLIESLSVDEQAVVGAFFNVLGDLLALNSSYLSSFQTTDSQSNEQDSNSQEDNQDNEYDLLKKSFQKLEEELNKIKQDKE